MGVQPRVLKWNKRDCINAHDAKGIYSKLYKHKLPTEFIEYCCYTSKLTYNTNPDYKRLRELFKKSAKKLHVELPYDYEFDWDIQDHIVENKTGRTIL